MLARTRRRLSDLCPISSSVLPRLSVCVERRPAEHVVVVVFGLRLGVCVLEFELVDRILVPALRPTVPTLAARPTRRFVARDRRRSQRLDRSDVHPHDREHGPVELRKVGEVPQTMIDGDRRNRHRPNEMRRLGVSKTALPEVPEEPHHVQVRGSVCPLVHVEVEADFVEDLVDVCTDVSLLHLRGDESLDLLESHARDDAVVGAVHRGQCVEEVARAVVRVIGERHKGSVHLMLMHRGLDRLRQQLPHGHPILPQLSWSTLALHHCRYRYPRSN
mmetsp:Transcript_36048/g.90759  ORF Transcript_36048/g.90759 Transcript_36048/m.90759 type:complete len:275 (+) Transcript_36048:626-1450(+)